MLFLVLRYKILYFYEPFNRKGSPAEEAVSLKTCVIHIRKFCLFVFLWLLSIATEKNTTWYTTVYCVLAFLSILQYTINLAFLSGIFQLKRQHFPVEIIIWEQQTESCTVATFPGIPFISIFPIEDDLIRSVYCWHENTSCRRITEQQKFSNNNISFTNPLAARSKRIGETDKGYYNINIKDSAASMPFVYNH